MIGFSPMEMMLVVILSLGGTGLPLGLPPTPEDPLLAKIAPEDCTFYLSWAGMAKPDPASPNHTEQLLAEQEIQRFVGELDKVISAALINEARDDDRARVMAKTIPHIVKAALTKPAAIFVGELEFGQVGLHLDAGLVVNTGDDTERLRGLVEGLEAVLPGEIEETEIDGVTWKEFPVPQGFPRTIWGFKGKYMVLGVGEKSVENIFARARKPAPEWLTKIRKELPVERPATVSYINLKKLIELSITLGGGRDRDAQTVLRVLGFENVQAIASVTGLDKTGFVSRQRLEIEGEPQGLFRFAAEKPLTADELSVIPRDATFAIAARADLKQLFADFVKGLGEVSPEARAEFDEELSQAEEELGIDLEDDLLSSIGDSWRVYNSPGEGGLLFTGLTAVAPVTDRDKLLEVFQKIEALAKEEEPDGEGAAFRRRYVTVDHFEFAGQTIYYMNFVGEESPFAPAWCATEKDLIVSLFPSHIKTFLSRGSDSQSLAEVDEVKAALRSNSPPVALAYQDTRQLFQLFYPIAQIVAQFIASEAQREGIALKIPMFPMATAIAPHMGPGVTTLQKTSAGLELLTRQSTPIGIGPLPMLMPLGWLGFGLRIDHHPMPLAGPHAIIQRAPAKPRAVPAR